jgi:putative hydrolase of the HAD superfamily
MADHYLFLDAGYTLVFPRWDVALRSLLERYSQVKLTDEHLRRAERAAKLRLDQAHGGSLASPVDAQFWDNFHSALLSSLGVNDASLIPEMVQGTRASANWRELAPELDRWLALLGTKYKLAVISNSDGSIERLFREVGLAHHFAAIIDSGAVGVQKPDVRIFEHALDVLGATAERSTYVGDVYSLDYLPPRRIGMHSVLMDTGQVYAETEHERVDSFATLTERLLG